MDEWETYASGERRHREYVDVVASFSRDGLITPRVVMWRDGRTFRIDEATEGARFQGPGRSTTTVRYSVRIGRVRTSVYLERRAARPEISMPERLLWWVSARDRVKPGRRPDMIANRFALKKPIKRALAHSATPLRQHDGR